MHPFSVGQRMSLLASLYYLCLHVAPVSFNPLMWLSHLNFPFKAKIVTLCASAIAGIVTGQLDNGTQPTDVKLQLSLSYLRPLFVGL